jgi:hypothetical protein
MQWQRKAKMKKSENHRNNGESVWRQAGVKTMKINNQKTGVVSRIMKAKNIISVKGRNGINGIGRRNEKKIMGKS